MKDQRLNRDDKKLYLKIDQKSTSLCRLFEPNMEIRFGLETFKVI
jgi:hypothetical protein